jgi:hypothetical protein
VTETGETISVVCSCGKKLKAPASAVGRKAKCPKCGNVLTVTAPPPADGDASLDALYDLAEESEQQASQQQMAPRCPSCMREMLPGAVLCTNCGYDARSGKAAAPKVAGTTYDPLAAAAALAANKKKKPTDKMAPQGAFWKGLLASGGGAVIGAMIWIMIAYGTGYTGMIPVVLIGILAGVGMVWGHEGYSYLGGASAAGIAFVVMILTRLAVIVALIIPSIQSQRTKLAKLKDEERMPDLSQYDYRVVEQLYEKQRKIQPPVAAAPEPAPTNEDEDGETIDPVDRQQVAVYQAVDKQLKAMPKAQYDAMVAKIEKDEQDSRLDDYLTEDILKTQVNVHPDRASSVEFAGAAKAAKEKIAGMTQPQRDAEYKRLNAQHEKEQEAARAAWQKEQAARRAARGKAGEDADRAVAHAAVALGAVAIFFLVFGGIGGGVLILLALGLAYRTASGSISD